MKKFALIVAGGTGTRMGSSIPKQFMEIMGRPIIHHTALAFVEAFADIQIIIVLPPAHLSAGELIFKDFISQYPLKFTVGGATRFHSVQNGLKLVGNNAVVFVHDAVRCLVSPKLIRKCYEQTVDKGSAIPVITVRDSVRLIDWFGLSSPVNREMLRSVQTPQTFLSEMLIPAFNQSYQPAFTDEATVVESTGQKINLIEGEESNIKITYPVDIIVAEKMLQSRQELS